MFKRIRRAAVAAFVILSACAAHAVPLPDSGLWGFDAEANGQPGRGFQIDQQQGNLMLFTYMGYRADGSPLFLQAGGEQANGTFEGDLVEFRGGTVLGGAYRNAQAAGSVGRMKIVFDSPTSGTLTLPGEAPRRVSRVVYENNVSRFNRDFLTNMNYPGNAVSEFQSLRMTARDGVLTMEIRETKGAYGGCKFTGPYSIAGSGIVSTGSFNCASSAGTYRTEELVVDAQGLLRGRIFRTLPGYSSEEFPVHLQGTCIGDGATITGFIPRCSFPSGR